MMRDMHSLDENIGIINSFSSYSGGNPDGGPVRDADVEILKEAAVICERDGIPQPEFFPFYDASGGQAEWQDGTWYIELDVRNAGISALIVKNAEYADAVRCRFEDIEEAMKLVKLMMREAVGKEGR